MSIRIVLSLILATLFATPAVAQTAAEEARHVLSSFDHEPAEEARRVLASFAHEPTVYAVQKAAARHAQVDPSAYADWRGQTAWANLMPERLNAEWYYLDRDEKDVRTTQSTGSQSQTVAGDDHARYKALVEWDLSRLIFNPDTLAASREVSRLVERREDLLTTVNKLYFARRQLQAETALSAIADTKRLIRTQLRLASLTADIDALTGGWFAQRVKVKTSGRAPSPGKVGARPLPSAAQR
jgi:hypothetical protein